MFTFILTAAPVSRIQFIIADAFSAALLKRRQNYADNFIDDHYDDDNFVEDHYDDDHYDDDDACYGEYDGNDSVHNCDT